MIISKLFLYNLMTSSLWELCRVPVLTVQHQFLFGLAANFLLRGLSQSWPCFIIQMILMIILIKISHKISCILIVEPVINSLEYLLGLPFWLIFNIPKLLYTKLKLNKLNLSFLYFCVYTYTHTLLSWKNI